MKYRPKDFDEMCLREFMCAMRGYYDEREEFFEDQLEGVRILGSLVITPHLKKGKKVKPEDIIKLPRDKKRRELRARKRPPIDRVRAMKLVEKWNKNGNTRNKDRSECEEP